MLKIKQKLLKIRKLNKKDKEKLLIKAITGIIVIYFLSSSLFFRSDNKEEKSNLEKKDKIESFDDLNLAEEKIYIHITGFVNSPGVLEMEDGKRLSDAIEKAGGLKEGADIKYLNLAKKLLDGEKIYIPNKEEVIEFEKTGNIIEKDNQRYMEKDSVVIDQENDIRNAEKESINKEAGKENSNKKININKVDKNELLSIPGVGEVTAEKIVKYRKDNGNFKTIDDIKKVDGIGDSKFEKMKTRITI